MLPASLSANLPAIVVGVVCLALVLYLWRELQKAKRAVKALQGSGTPTKAEGDTPAAAGGGAAETVESTPKGLHKRGGASDRSARRAAQAEASGPAAKAAAGALESDQ